jgi:Interferon-inducible GTPase (IIGP)
MTYTTSIILFLVYSVIQAAVTGETEATIKPRAYRHPDLRTMVLWDLPGAATLHHPAETYFEDKFLCAFDALIIVMAER